MIAYVDSSVLLRVVLTESRRLVEWKRLERRLSSELTRFECLRTIDRSRLRHGLDDKTVTARRTAVFEHLERFEMIPLQPEIIERASQPFPTSLGTLDAIHLATAVLARPIVDDLVFATHDEALGLGAQAVGFRVVGL